MKKDIIEDKNMDLIIQVEGEDEILISAPETLEELGTTLKLSRGSRKGQPVLFYERKERWVKIIDNNTYQKIIRDASNSGKEELELRLQISGENKPVYAIPNIPVCNLPSTSEDWNLSSERSQPSTGIQFSVETVSYVRMDTNDRNYVRLHVPGERTLQELSSIIVKNEGFGSEWTCALYSFEGHPLTGNLSQMLYTKCSDVLEDEARICVFVVPNFGQKTLEPLDPSDGPIELTIADHSNAALKHSVWINHDTTVEKLKQKVYAITGIPTFEIKLQTDNDHLKQDDKLLSSYSNLSSVKFERISVEYEPSSYKKISKQSVEQSDEGIRTLHSFLYCFSKISASCESPTLAQFLSGVRKASNNCTPLLHALYELSQNKKMSLLETIALEEGFMSMIKRFMASVFKEQVHENRILEYTLDVCGIIANIYNSKSDAHKEETFRQIDIIDPLEYTVMKNPVLVTKNNGTVAYYDRQSLLNKISSNQSIEGVSRLSKDSLAVDNYYKMIIKRCELNGKTSMFAWTGSFSPKPSLTDHISAVYRSGLNWSRAANLKKDFKITKIVPSLSLKDTNFKHCMTLDKLEKICINLGLTPKKPNEVDLLDVLTSEKLTIDVDDLASAIEMESTEESKECLTRTPAEAIVVVFDKSISMGSTFANNHEFTRLDATKQFFESFADRSVGYNYSHAISLILFDSYTERACGFTENLSTFAYHVQKCSSSGETRLFDTISVAIDDLKEFQRIYANCELRILCLSDGEDTRSTTTPLEVAKKLLLNQVTLDSVVVGKASDDLKAISFATGGYVFFTKSVQDGIKLFESETFLSLRNRDPPTKTHVISTADLRCLANRPFSKDLPAMKKPSQLSSQQEHPKTTVRRAAATPPQFQNVGIGARFKRIMRELNNLANIPHSSIEVYPAVDDPNFWNAYMQGPEETPYQGGVFHIYIAFGENYPQEPPEIRFITPIYHCNINSNGRICHSILDQFYRVDVTVRHILDCIYGLLMVPEPHDPLDANIAAEYLDSPKVYSRRATQFTNQHAIKRLNKIGDTSSAPSHLCDPITKAIMSDPVICIKTNTTYERREIEEIINRTGKDPFTGQRIGIEDLIPNNNTKQAIEEYIKNTNNPWFLKK